MKTNSLAGTVLPPRMLIDITKLVTAYYSETPDTAVPAERISFGTSGHRGTSFKRSFNENHVLAITQAICLYRKLQNTDGPLFLGIDTHALSLPASITALEVLAANEVEVMIAAGNEYTPTPVISHAILAYNRSRKNGLSDGIVVTPSHNPPQDGGFKYNPSSGGPADTVVTSWIERKANELLENGLTGVRRLSHANALRASTTHEIDYLDRYIADLGQVVEMEIIREAKLSLGVDPLGGAGVHYWSRIAERYGLNISVVSEVVDPTFGFMTADWDGQIRMDPSSVYAMQRLIQMKDHFDLSFACDTDYDRHGIVTKSEGLLPPNHFLCAAIFHLFQNRPNWSTNAAIGKTLVSSQMIDRICTKLSRKLYETPVGFKWFVNGLLDGSLAFAGEESAGATFARLDGSVWTTDKDGIIPCLLAAEIAARTGHDPGEMYQDLSLELGESNYGRIEIPATREQKILLHQLTPEQVTIRDIAGEKILNVLTHAGAHDSPIGGLKVVTENGWLAVRPSGTEDILKIYAESFSGKAQLQRILDEAQAIVSEALKGAQGRLTSTVVSRHSP